MRSVLVVVVAAVLFSGCGTGDCEGVFCGPCPVPLTLRVVDGEMGGPVPDVEVEGAQERCEVQGEVTVCAVGERRGAGDYALTLTAPDYAARELDVRVPGDASGDDCCSCGYEPVTADVALSPSG
ncbi:MAG: hypothetical protein ACOCUS_02740 [Polyangiales bacterium]